MHYIHVFFIYINIPLFRCSLCKNPCNLRKQDPGVRWWWRLREVFQYCLSGVAWRENCVLVKVKLLLMDQILRKPVEVGSWTCTIQVVGRNPVIYKVFAPSQVVGNGISEPSTVGMLGQAGGKASHTKWCELLVVRYSQLARAFYAVEEFIDSKSAISLRKGMFYIELSLSLYVSDMCIHTQI